MPGCVLQARQGEGESTPDDILEMVKAQAAPPTGGCQHEQHLSPAAGFKL